jgi:WD40 repeat protein
VIDPRSGRVRALQPAHSSDGCTATTPSFTPDSRLMAVVDGCIHVTVWDVRSGRVESTIELPDRASGSGARISPDGRYVLVSVLGGAFVRADLASGQVAEVPGAQAEGNVLAISPDGRFYAVGRHDGTVDEYDARSLRLVRHHVLVNAIETLAFSADSAELAVEDTSNVLRVWDTCAECENPARLAQLAAQQSVRKLSPSERATFNVG